MFDYTITAPTRWGNIYCSILFFIIIGLYWKRCVIDSRIVVNNRKGGGLLAILIALFAVTSWYTGDFFGYQKLVGELNPDLDAYHLERIYAFIIQITNHNYLLFRIIVWGGAIVCYLQSLKVLDLNRELSLFVLFILFTTPFCYARATLAMSVYYLGLVLLIKAIELHKVRNIVVALGIVLSSYFFHKSMAPLIGLTLFCFIPVTKKTIVPILLLALLFGYGIDQLANSFQDFLMGFGDEQLVSKIEQSREMFEGRQSRNASFFGWVVYLWSYAPFYISFIIVTWVMLKKKVISKPLVGMYRICFAIVIISTAILLFSSSSLVYFYRYLYMSLIPLSILIAFLFSKGYMQDRLYKIILFLGGGYNIYTFFSYCL